MIKVNKLQKLITAVIAVILFALSFSPATVAILSKNGSITIHLSDPKTGNAIPNASFDLYCVANSYLSEGIVKHELIVPFDEANIDISDLQDSYLPIHLMYFASSLNLPHLTKATDQNGVAVFGNLTPALYLVAPSNDLDSNFSPSPFLISIPRYDSQNQTWEYDINASPKVLGGNEDTEKTYISVTKKWDTESNHPDSITVVLLRDFVEYEKITLDKSNNWYYRWDNLSTDHVWSVVETEVPDGYTAYYETSSNTVTIINKSDDTSDVPPPPPPDEGEKLPQTGQLNWPIPIFAIMGLILFSIGWAVLNFGRKDNE